jgi:thiosulfate dehydrogenase [quinone] large subunit
MHYTKQQIYWIVLRLIMGWIFLWAFFDKVFGLGFSTSAKNAWLSGSSPTSGFLKSLNGSFASFFNNLAGNSIVDWLFMFALLSIGIALVLGIFLKFTSYMGIIFMLTLWLASFPSKANPFIDQHIIYILIFIGFIIYDCGKYFAVEKYLRNLLNLNLSRNTKTDLIKE